VRIERIVALCASFPLRTSVEPAAGLPDTPLCGSKASTACWSSVALISNGLRGIPPDGATARDGALAAPAKAPELP